MRAFGGLALLAALLAIGGCDKSQPLLVGEQTVAVTFDGVSATTPQYNVWDIFEDNDLDGVPDGDTYLWCEIVVFPFPEDPNLSPISAPWNFSVQISVIKAGTTQEIQITTDAALAVTANLSSYDTASSTKFTFNKPPITVDDMGTQRTFAFANPRKFTPLHRDVVQATFNPLSAIDPVTYPYQEGLCSLQDAGDSHIDDQGNPYSLPLDKGDTVIVRARRGAIPPEFITPPEFVPVYTTEPAIDASMTLDGVPLANGASTQNAFGAPLTLTFSTR
jgi:hypothetical protein